MDVACFLIKCFGGFLSEMVTAVMQQWPNGLERFGLTIKGLCKNKDHTIVVVLLVMLCIGYMAYAFVGVGEFFRNLHPLCL
jgi:hypothetical protein